MTQTNLQKAEEFIKDRPKTSEFDRGYRHGVMSLADYLDSQEQPPKKPKIDKITVLTLTDTTPPTSASVSEVFSYFADKINELIERENSK